MDVQKANIFLQSAVRTFQVSPGLFLLVIPVDWDPKSIESRSQNTHFACNKHDWTVTATKKSGNVKTPPNNLPRYEDCTQAKEVDPDAKPLRFTGLASQKPSHSIRKYSKILLSRSLEWRAIYLFALRNPIVYRYKSFCQRRLSERRQFNTNKKSKKVLVSSANKLWRRQSTFGLDCPGTRPWVECWQVVDDIKIVDYVPWYRSHHALHALMQCSQGGYTLWSWSSTRGRSTMYRARDLHAVVMICMQLWRNNSC